MVVIARRPLHIPQVVQMGVKMLKVKKLIGNVLFVLVVLFVGIPSTIAVAILTDLAEMRKEKQEAEDFKNFLKKPIPDLQFTGK